MGVMRIIPRQIARPNAIFETRLSRGAVYRIIIFKRKGTAAEVQLLTNLGHLEIHGHAPTADNKFKTTAIIVVLAYHHGDEASHIKPNQLMIVVYTIQIKSENGRNLNNPNQIK